MGFVFSQPLLDMVSIALIYTKKAGVARHLRALINTAHTPLLSLGTPNPRPTVGLPCPRRQGCKWTFWRSQGFSGSEPSAPDTRVRSTVSACLWFSHINNTLHLSISFVPVRTSFSDEVTAKNPPIRTACDSCPVFLPGPESPHLKRANTLLKHLTSRDRIKPGGRGECRFD